MVTWRIYLSTAVPNKFSSRESQHKDFGGDPPSVPINIIYSTPTHKLPTQMNYSWFQGFWYSHTMSFTMFHPYNLYIPLPAPPQLQFVCLVALASAGRKPRPVRHGGPGATRGRFGGGVSAWRSSDALGLDCTGGMNHENEMSTIQSNELCNRHHCASQHALTVRLPLPLPSSTALACPTCLRPRLWEGRWRPGCICRGFFPGTRPSTKMWGGFIAPLETPSTPQNYI